VTSRPASPTCITNKPDAAEEGKVELTGAAKKKKLVKVPVKIQYIRALEARPPIPPRYPRGLS
jgi:hypothetical protein